MCTDSTRSLIEKLPTRAGNKYHASVCDSVSQIISHGLNSPRDPENRRGLILRVRLRNAMKAQQHNEFTEMLAFEFIMSRSRAYNQPYFHYATINSSIPGISSKISTPRHWKACSVCNTSASRRIRRPSVSYVAKPVADCTGFFDVTCFQRVSDTAVSLSAWNS